MKKNFKKIRFLTIILTFAAWALTLNKKVWAQSIVRLSAIPPRIEITVNPGEVNQQAIKVRNEGQTELAIQTKILDFIVEDDQGTPIPANENLTGRWSGANWTSVSPSKFVIKPGETKVLDLIIIAPEDAAAGGHYVEILYEPISESKEQGTSSFVSPNVGTLVYITVPGDINEEAYVRKMDLPKFSEYGPIKIITEIENLSDIHIKPLGTIRFYNFLGALSSTLKLEELNIFPGKSRIYENTWNRKWLFGRYKALLEAGYGNQGNNLTATVYFWVIPYKIILIGLLAAIVIVLTIVYLKKKKRVEIEQ